MTEKVRILIIDDDTDMLETLGDILQEKGYVTETAKTGKEALTKAEKEKGYLIAKASSGEEAIQLVQHRDFDVVFIQAKMPVMNGLETYQRLRKTRANIKVVMTTNYRTGMEEVISQAIHESAYACIYKPFDVKKILHLLGGIMLGKTKTEIQEME